MYDVEARGCGGLNRCSFDIVESVERPSPFPPLKPYPKLTALCAVRNNEARNGTEEASYL